MVTKKESEMLGKIGPVENISAKTSQLIHGLLFEGEGTIDNIEFQRNVYYKGDTETISVRDWDEKKFQIVWGVSSARYPPKLHLPEIKGGIQKVINQLEKKNKSYEIIETVPKSRQDIFPQRYIFSHDTQDYDVIIGHNVPIGSHNYVTKGRTKIRDYYKFEGKWNCGDTFWGETFPEDVSFLTRFLKALNKL